MDPRRLLPAEPDRSDDDRRDANGAAAPHSANLPPGWSRAVSKLARGAAGLPGDPRPAAGGAGVGAKREPEPRPGDLSGHPSVADEPGGCIRGDARARAPPSAPDSAT